MNRCLDCHKPINKRSKRCLSCANKGKRNPAYGKKDNREKSKKITKFIKENQNKHLCKCGCGKYIEIKRRHYKKGIPEYKHSHYLKIYTWNRDKKIQSNTGRTHFKKGQHPSPATEFKKGHKGWNKNLPPEKHPSYIDGRSIIPNYCPICNKKISWNAKHCRSCAKIQEKNPLWNNGSSFEPYPNEFNNVLRENIRQRDDYKCQLCGVPQIECEQRLSVHHIDYNKKNNKSNNLISLCFNCHNKVHYDRDFWKLIFKEVKQNGRSSQFAPRR